MNLSRDHIVPYLEANNRYYVRWAWPRETEATRAAVLSSRLAADRGDLAGEFENLYTFLSNCIQTGGVTRALQLTLLWLHLRAATTAIECNNEDGDIGGHGGPPLTFWDIVANVTMTSLKLWLLQTYDVPCVLYATKTLLPHRVYEAIASNERTNKDVDWGAQIKRSIRELCKRNRFVGCPSSVALTRRVDCVDGTEDIPYFDTLVDMYRKHPSISEPFLEFGEEFAFSTVLFTYLGLRPRLAVLLNYYRWRVRLFAATLTAKRGSDKSQRFDRAVRVVVEHVNKICENCINCNFGLANTIRGSVTKELTESVKYLVELVNVTSSSSSVGGRRSL